MDNSSSKASLLLFEAAEKNDLEAVKSYIEENPDLATITDDKDQTLVLIAAKNGNLDMIKFINEKAPSFITTPGMHYVRTALELAVEHGSLDVVKYLIETFEKDVSDPKENVLETIMPLVIQFGRLDILKYFIEEKKVNADQPGKWQHQAPVFDAIEYRHKDIFKYLVEEKKANLTSLNWIGENILFVALRRDDLDTMKYLLDEKKIKFDINAGNYRGETLVHKAALLNRMKILEYLVDEKHADIDIWDTSDNMTALHNAALGEHYESSKFLMDHGANFRVRDLTGQTAAEKTSDPRIRELLSPTDRTRRDVEEHYARFQPIELTSDPGLRGLNGNRTNTPEYLPQLQSFLVLAGILTRDIKVFAKRHSRKFPSPQETLQRQMKSVALDSVHTLPKFDHV